MENEEIRNEIIKIFEGIENLKNETPKNIYPFIYKLKMLLEGNRKEFTQEFCKFKYDYDIKMNKELTLEQEFEELLNKIFELNQKAVKENNEDIKHKTCLLLEIMDRLNG